MNRWLLNYECKLLVVAFEKPSTRISCCFENLPHGEFEIFSLAKICCASSRRLACLTVAPCNLGGGAKNHGLQLSHHRELSISMQHGLHFQSKLRATNNKTFFELGRLEVCICKYQLQSQVAQAEQHESRKYGWYHWTLPLQSLMWWSQGLVTILNPLCFPSEIHLNIKDNVGQSFMPIRGRFCFRTKDFENNSNITHLISKCILPKGIAILAINLNFTFHGAGKFNAIFVACFMNSWVHGWNIDIPLTQYIRDPPRKDKLLPNVVSHGVLSDLDRIRLFKDFQFNPLSWAFGPLDQELLSHSCLAHSFSTSLCDELLVGHGGGLPWTFMIYNMIQERARTTISIQFHEDVWGNCISSIFPCCTIIEFTLIE